MLEKVKHNGHDGGRMELTLMRQWVMTHLIYEYLLALPDDCHPLERAFVDNIIHREGSTDRGSMMSELATHRFRATRTDGLVLPARVGKPIDIMDLLPNGTAYGLLLQYLQGIWPDLNLIADTSPHPGTLFDRRKSSTALSFIRKDGIRYGSSQNKRSRADSFAFISDGSAMRIPVEIISILNVKINNKPAHICAIVKRLYSDTSLPQLPWDL